MREYLNTVTPDLDEIKRAINVLFEPRQIVELRAIGKRTFSHCYNDSEKLAAAIFDIAKNQDYEGVYWTAQQINPEFRGSRSIADEDICGYRWLLIDADPIRKPSKISSSDAEKAAALDVILSVRQHLSFLGIFTILADSGNGYHLLSRIDLPAGDKHIVKRILECLSAKFSTGAVKIDTVVFNPARIWKAYGTVARKGENNAERPHRIARIIDVPDQLNIVPKGVLEMMTVMGNVVQSTPNLSDAELLSESEMKSRFETVFLWGVLLD